MIDFIKTFGLPIIMFIVLAWASLDVLGCEGEPVYPETVEAPTFLFVR